MCLGKPKGPTFRLISAILVFSFMASFVMPGEALAARSRAGGGDVPEFSFSDFAVTAGIGVGTAIIGSSIGGALGSVWDGIKGGLDATTIVSNMGSAFTSGFSSAPSFTTTMISGYNTFMAGTQVVRAVGSAGVYYDWNPATTFILSSVASGVTGGLLNPGSALGSAFNKTVSNTGFTAFTTMLKGAAVGGLGGLASSEVAVLIDRDRISQGLSPGVGAQIAGYTAGFFATSFGRDLFDPKTYAPAKETYTRKVIGQEVGEKITKPIFGYASDSGKVLTEQQVFDMAGVEQVKRSLINDGSISEKQFDSKKPTEILRDVQRFYAKSDPMGENTYVIIGDKRGLEFSNVSSDQRFNAQEMQVINDNTIALRTGDTNIFKNILFKPFIDTFDAWPMLATNALGTWAASRVDDNYSQFIKLAVSSVGGAVLDSFAEAYSLRPSAWGAQEWLGNAVPRIEGMAGKDLGKSSFTRFTDNLSRRFTTSSVKYEILSNLLAGGISVAANSLIGTKDRETGLYKRPIDSMLISLAGVLGTGVARGVAWNLYNESLRSDDIQAGVQYLTEENKNIKLSRVDSFRPAGFVDSVIASLDTDASVKDSAIDGYPIAPDYTSTASRNYVIVDNKDRSIISRPDQPGYENWEARLKKREEGYKLINGTLYPVRQYYVTLDDGAERDVSVIPIPKNPDMVKTILGSVNQSLYEFGSQSMAMNLPFAPEGTLNTSAWVNYSQNLFSSSRAAASRGFWQIMENNVVSTGVDVIRRNSLSAIADTPLGKLMGAAPFITFEGFKNQPFNVAVLYATKETLTGKTVGNTVYYAEGMWPNSARIDISPEDAAWRRIISKSRMDLLGRNGPNEKNIEDPIKNLIK